MAGRPTKLTKPVIRRICEGIRLGMTQDMAAARAGVARATFYRWKAEGEKQKAGAKRDFRDALTRAEADGQAALLATVQEAAAGRQGDWRAASWILERRHREGFGKTLEVKAEVHSEVQLRKIVIAQPEDVQGARERLRAQGGQEPVE